MKITLGTTYYNSPKELNIFICNHIEYVDELIVVDDGSQIYPAVDYITPVPKLKLYRVKKDYGFNSHGCRNLIMKEAFNDWVILLDVDRQFINPKQHIETIKSRKLKDNTLYRFVTVRIRRKFLDYGTVHASVNDFLVNKNHFFKAGGYDEELQGLRMGDREYFEQLNHYGNESLLHDVEIVLLRPPTITLSNKVFKSINDKSRVPDKIMSLIHNRMKVPEPNKPILTFEWEKMF